MFHYCFITRTLDTNPGTDTRGDTRCDLSTYIPFIKSYIRFTEYVFNEELVSIQKIFEYACSVVVSHDISSSSKIARFGRGAYCR